MSFFFMFSYFFLFFLFFVSFSFVKYLYCKICQTKKFIKVINYYFFMEKDNCIFCKIVSGELESAKIWEDDEFLAILDIMPNTEGMTLVLTKEHYHSDVLDMPEDVYLRFLSASKKVAEILKKGLGVVRVGMVIECMGIDHAHIKLYPLHGVKEKFEEIWAEEKIFFEKYEGHICTKTGPEVDLVKLKRLAEKIKKKI